MSAHPRASAVHRLGLPGLPSDRAEHTPDALRLHLPELGGDCEVWLVDPEAPGRYGARGPLNASERARADRFLRDRDRRLFIAAHHLLRHHLGRAVEIPPAELRFVHGPHGRPELAAEQQPPGPPWSFSLSHTRGLAGVALARGVRVGFDLEEARAVDALRLARGILDADERATLARLPDPARWHRFLRLWTLKEAALKIHGAGLTLPADLLGVRGPDNALRVVSAPEGLAPSGLRLRHTALQTRH